MNRRKFLQSAAALAAARHTLDSYAGSARYGHRHQATPPGQNGRENLYDWPGRL